MGTLYPENLQELIHSIMSDDKKIIFSMVGVSKSTPQGKQIIKNIYLSFFYGAKIGIIGLNGSGKSTIMKIIAGLDQSYQGDVVFSPGYSVGYLPQEPELDPNKTVKEVVLEGAKEIADALESGAVKPDIYTKTLAWYTELIEWEKRMKDLAPDGNIL
jgi:ATPase subunit of ABC transporter with duplicated ATPase domains